MVEIVAPFLTQIFSAFANSIQSYRSPDWADAEIHPRIKKTLANLACLVYIQSFSHVFDDDSLQMRVRILQNALESNQKFTGEMLARELEGLHTQATMCLSKRKFAYIPAPGDGYFEKEKLFGEAVFDAFPEARQDIKEVGNCIACQLHNAAVFHCMRVAEHGLLKIARRLKLKSITGRKNIHITEADWKTLIAALQTKLESIHQSKTLSAARSKRLAKYSDALDQARAMKDIWRNGISHLNSYNEYQAMDAMARVKGFMVRIEEGL